MRPDIRPNCSSSGAEQQSTLLEKLSAAVSFRERLFGPFSREPETSAYRLVNSEGDGIDGLTVDSYAGFLVVQVLRDDALATALAVEKLLEDLLRPRGIVRKLRHLQEGRGRVPEDVARGEKPPGVLTVMECGVPFEVELLGGLHTGLFTDMREEHQRMRRLAAGRRVLNTFAYTGAFSVAAALGGAAQVTSVDVVEKVLERAKRNFRLAGIEDAGHHFARMEVLEYLRMARRRGWRFDAIVLDPPTFAAFKSGNWSLKNSYPELIGLALDVLDPGGLLWVAANTDSLPPARLDQMVQESFDSRGRHARTIAISSLPPDYPTPLSRPEARYLKVHVILAD